MSFRPDCLRLPPHSQIESIESRSTDTQNFRCDEFGLGTRAQSTNSGIMHSDVHGLKAIEDDWGVAGASDVGLLQLVNGPSRKI